MNTTRHIWTSATACLLLTAAATVHAEVTFQGLGDLPGGVFDSFANGVSANGAVVVGRGASASSNREAFRWEAGVMTGLGDLPGGSFSNSGSDLSANGVVVVGFGNSASGDEGFRWEADVMTGLGDLPGGSFSSFARGTQGIAVGKSGQAFVTFAQDQAAVWKRTGDSWALSHRSAHFGFSSKAILSRDEEYILIPAQPRFLRTFRLRDGVLMNELNEHSAKVTGIAPSPAGDRLATASFDHSIRVFDFPSGKLVHRLLGHQGTTWQVAWSPQQDSIASVGSDETLRLWDLQRGSTYLHLKVPADHPATSRAL